MGFEWDDEKNRRNVRLHGIDFDAASTILTDEGIEKPSHRRGEQRWMFTGPHEGRLWTVIYTRRGQNKRIISARRARKSEEDDYHKTFS
jgi:uncharacterized DUF497 family protein